jgi:uncharacterized membrane protein
MDSNWMEWLNLALRWTHLIAGIMWIGNSFYFMWLDSNLEVPEPPDPDVEGKLWMVHSGGFYSVERRKIYPGKMPKVLHWFKWEATFTWITGFCLLTLVYYMTNGMYLLDPEVSDLTPGFAVTLSLGILVCGWLLYDSFMQTPIAKNAWVRNGVLVSAVCGLSYWLCHNFSGRGAFIQLGALFGTLMVLNVWVRILPSQQRMIDATDRGETPNYEESKIAKARSTHNSYMTLPVLFMMLSNHYAFLFGHTHNWVLLILLCVLGAGIRHLTLQGKSGLWAIGPTGAALVSLLVMTNMTWSDSNHANIGNVEFSQVHNIVNKRCLSCHSASPSEKLFGPSPGGINFDNPENIKVFASKIKVQAVVGKIMPLANKTQMTAEERATLGAWIDQYLGSQ